VQATLTPTINKLHKLAMHERLSIKSQPEASRGIRSDERGLGRDDDKNNQEHQKQPRPTINTQL